MTNATPAPATLPSLEAVAQLVHAVHTKLAAVSSEQQVQALRLTTNGRGSSQWAQAVSTQIEQLVAPDAHNVRAHVIALRTQLIYSHLLDDAPLEPVLGVLEAMVSIAMPEVRVRVGAPIAWPALVEAAYVAEHLNNYHPELSDRHLREFTVGAAGRRLRERGFAVEQKGDRLGFSDEDHDRVIAQLEAKIKALGGLAVARHLFQTMAPVFDPVQGRYHVRRQGGSFGRSPPRAPIGYLFALAAKHLQRSARTQDVQGEWDAIMALAIDFAAIHDVQDYVPPIFSDPTPNELLDQLARRALYDSLFLFPQLRATDTCRILRNLLWTIPPDRVFGSGWTLPQALVVIEHLYRCAGTTRGPLLWDARKLAAQVPGVPAAIALRVLLEVFAHPPEGANVKFSRPTDRTLRGIDPHASPGNNLYFRPLLRLDAKRVLMLDSAMAGPAFIEAVLSGLRADIGGNAFQQNFVGPGLEHLLQQELAAHGITLTSGDYDVGGIHGECDGVIDAPGHLVFFENKAKALTRDAGAGSDVAVTLSLAGSVIAAHEQALGHEVELRTHQGLTLVRPGATHELVWQDQQVDRVALALFDYGAFQDRTAVAKLLRHIVAGRYQASDPAQQAVSAKEFAKLNKSLDDLRSHLERWKVIAKDEDPFFDTWFLSVPQLLVVLDGVRSAREFLDRLDMMRRLTYQTYNFYFEFKLAMAQHAQRPKPATPALGL